MADEFFERAGKLAAKRLGLEELPFVERRAVAERKASHEIVLVERGGFGQRRDAARTRFVRGMTVSGAVRQPFMEFVDIDVERGVCRESNCFAVDLQLFAGECAMQDRERAAERGARGFDRIRSRTAWRACRGCGSAA